MKYKSSFTKGIKLAVLILLLFWLVNTFVTINSNGIKDVIVSSTFMLVFIAIFILAFTKATYIVVKNKSIKYVRMFILRNSVEIEKINKIQKDIAGGLYTSLLLAYKDGGKLKNIKIVTLTFKNDTLRQFVSDLKNRNPQIEVDESVNELIT